MVEAPAAECRKVTKRGKIKLFYEITKVEFHIRVTRCTNCQDLNNHTKSQCEYGTRCAKCSDRHNTNDCTETKVKCINCVRSNKNDTEHPAYSSKCPIFQHEKQKRLQGYYQSKAQTIDPHNKNAENTTTHKIEDQSKRQRENRYVATNHTGNFSNYKDSREAGNDHEKEVYPTYRRKLTPDLIEKK